MDRFYSATRDNNKTVSLLMDWVFTIQLFRNPIKRRKSCASQDDKNDTNNASCKIYWPSTIFSETFLEFMNKIWL